MLTAVKEIAPPNATRSIEGRRPRRKEVSTVSLERVRDPRAIIAIPAMSTGRVPNRRTSLLAR